MSGISAVQSGYSTATNRDVYLSVQKIAMDQQKNVAAELLQSIGGGSNANASSQGLDVYA